jgi:pimeloyl-ACP methyl ester carboxylesterase
MKALIPSSNGVRSGTLVRARTKENGSMQIIERRIDVTEAAELGVRVEMAVTIHLPDPDLLPEIPVAIFACPGGGYSRRYFMMHFEGHEGYAEAIWHAGRGTIHVAIDHVGVGESTIPDLSRIGFGTLATTHDSCVRQIAQELRVGTLAKGFPALRSLFRVGMGQSMGGGVSILAQGNFATFDAIAPCGVSAIHTALPQRDKAAFDHGKARFDAVAEGNARSHLETDHAGVDYLYAFHWEDVPADILDADMKGGYPIRQTSPDFGSLTIPHCAVAMMLPGAFASDAAKVTVPVLVANGERDTCPNPHAEATAYPATRDVTIFIVPNMAHMHNFASTREKLWQRLHDWSRLQAAATQT